MIQLIGSFATLWLLLWLAGVLVLVASYPHIRSAIVRLEPSFGSALLLSLMSVPMVFSLMTASLLFTPLFESFLVRAHCHTSCDSHLPSPASSFLAMAGLLILAAIVGSIAAKLVQHIRIARSITSQLDTLGRDEKSKGFRSLPDSHAIVLTVGWWRNKIYMSDSLVSACTENEIDIILAHERAHAQRKDNLRLTFAQLVTLLLPRRFCATLMEDLQLLTESACDFHAANQFDDLDVAEAIIKVYRLIPERTQLAHGLSVAGEACVEQRVMALLNRETLYRPSSFTTLSLTCALVICAIALVNPLHHLIEWL